MLSSLVEKPGAYLFCLNGKIEPVAAHELLLYVGDRENEKPGNWIPLLSLSQGNMDCNSIYLNSPFHRSAHSTLLNFMIPIWFVNLNSQGQFWSFFRWALWIWLQQGWISIKLYISNQPLRGCQPFFLPTRCSHLWKLAGSEAEIEPNTITITIIYQPPYSRKWPKVTFRHNRNTNTNDNKHNQ